MALDNVKVKASGKINTIKPVEVINDKKEKETHNDITVDLTTDLGGFSLKIRSKQRDSNAAVEDVRRQLYELGKGLAAAFDVSGSLR